MNAIIKKILRLQRAGAGNQSQLGRTLSHCALLLRHGVSQVILGVHLPWRDHFVEMHSLAIIDSPPRIERCVCSLT